MSIQVPCSQCGGLFEPDDKEIRGFIKHRADEISLYKIPFPKEKRAQYKSRMGFIFQTLRAYCPYCLSVLFGGVWNKSYPRDRLTEENYLRAIEEEIHETGGMQINDPNLPLDGPYFVIDNDKRYGE